MDKHEEVEEVKKGSLWSVVRLPACSGLPACALPSALPRPARAPLTPRASSPPTAAALPLQARAQAALALEAQEQAPLAGRRLQVPPRPPNACSLALWLRVWRRLGCVPAAQPLDRAAQELRAPRHGVDPLPPQAPAPGPPVAVHAQALALRLPAARPPPSKVPLLLPRRPLPAAL